MEVSESRMERVKIKHVLKWQLHVDVENTMINALTDCQDSALTKKLSAPFCRFLMNRESVKSCAYGILRNSK